MHKFPWGQLEDHEAGMEHAYTVGDVRSAYFTTKLKEEDTRKTHRVLTGTDLSLDFIGKKG